MKAVAISIIAILSVCAFGQDSPKILLNSEELGEMPMMERVELHDDGTLHFLIQLEPEYFNRVAKNPDEFARWLQSSLSVFSQDPQGVTITKRRYGKPFEDAPDWLTFKRHLGIDSSRPYEYAREKEWFPYKFVAGTEPVRQHRFIIPLKTWLASTGIPEALIEANRFKLRQSNPLPHTSVNSLAQLKGNDKRKVIVPPIPKDVESDFFSFPSKERAAVIEESEKNDPELAPRAPDDSIIDVGPCCRRERQSTLRGMV